MKNPHFDDNRVIWKDEYSGLYEPINYSEQFDQQWRLFLENKIGFTKHTGVETDDAWVDDRIFDLTGIRGLSNQNINENSCASSHRETGGNQTLNLQFSADHFKNKECLDAACGAGRWTRALMALEGNVKSIDISEHGLKSVRRFNKNVECLDLFDIPSQPHLHNAFDFTICWGVVMCTHNPRLAFENVAKTVKQDGELYIMVYAPNYHNNPDILKQRKHYHQNLTNFDEKLEYAYEISDCKENAINYLDMLHTYYNWVIEEETLHKWFHENGFSEVVTLNSHEKYPVAYHILGRKRNFKPAYYDDHGNRLPNMAEYDTSKAITLAPSAIMKENGWALKVSLAEFSTQSDNMEKLDRSRLIILEDGIPLWYRHSEHDKIRNTGNGLYSHWQDYLLFSTSDNTDPYTNNRHYQIAFSKT